MQQPFSSNESKLRKAAEFLSADHKKDARLLIRDVLAADGNNLMAWELLFQASYNTAEQTLCLERLLRLQPNHPWAGQQLERVKASTSTGTGMGKSLSGQYPQKVPAFPKPRKKKRREPLLVWAGILFSCLGILCLGLWGLAIYRVGFLPIYGNNQTATAYASNQANCQALIDQAMQASGQYCDQIGSNRVCYGNNTIKADLVANANQRFSERGDVINITQLQRLSASPLNTLNREWGIAVFKVQANLPRSLPGETVKMVVFGNTSLDKNGESLQSFYFSSDMGQIVCEKVPFDGLMVTMPDGTGIKFIVNGAEMTLMGNASFKAAKGDKMEVSLFSGSARIVSNGQEQYFGAGQKVDVKLGGANGNESVGPPSAPQPLSPEEMSLACTLTDSYCSQNDITPVSPEQAQAGVQSGLGITPTLTNTPPKTSTGTATITQTALVIPSLTKLVTMTGTSTKTLTPIRTKTPLVSPTRTFTPKPVTVIPGPPPTRTHTPTHTLTPTVTGTATVTQTPTITLTPLPPTETDTPTVTLTPTNTFTPAGPTACDSSVVTTDNYTNSPADELRLEINNTSGDKITLDSLYVGWDDSTGQKLDEIKLGGNSLVTTRDNTSPSDYPSEIPWDDYPSGHHINDGDTETLIIRFKDDLASYTYTIQATFNIGCYVQVSSTFP